MFQCFSVSVFQCSSVGISYKYVAELLNSGTLEPLELWNPSTHLQLLEYQRTYQRAHGSRLKAHAYFCPLSFIFYLLPSSIWCYP